MSRAAGHVLVLTGGPGSGKTTVADVLARREPLGAHLQADDFYAPTLKGGYVEPWLPSSEAQNQTVCRALARAAFAYAEGGYAVVLDGIVGPWFVGHFEDEARGRGLPLHYAVLRVDVELAVARVATRDRGRSDTGVVRTLHAQLSVLGPLERHVVPAAGDPARVAADVAAARDEGRLRLC